MARIGTSRDKPKAPPVGRQLAPVSETVWMVGLVGGLVVAIGAPDEASWLVRGAAVVVAVVCGYGLGRAHGQARPDPAARGRVSQLERAFTQLALLAGYDGLARRPDGSRTAAAGTEPAADAGAEPVERDKPTGGRPGTSAADVGLTEAGR